MPNTAKGRHKIIKFILIKGENIQLIITKEMPAPLGVGFRCELLLFGISIKAELNKGYIL